MRPSKKTAARAPPVVPARAACAGAATAAAPRAKAQDARTATRTAIAPRVRAGTPKQTLSASQAKSRPAARAQPTRTAAVTRVWEIAVVCHPRTPPGAQRATPRVVSALPVRPSFSSTPNPSARRSWLPGRSVRPTTSVTPIPARAVAAARQACLHLGAQCVMPRDRASRAPWVRHFPRREMPRA